jgi:hypothetical protein
MTSKNMSLAAAGPRPSYPAVGETAFASAPANGGMLRIILSDVAFARHRTKRGPSTGTD